MAIKHQEGAQYPSVKEFVSLFRSKLDTSPSFTNLFSFHIISPPILRPKAYGGSAGSTNSDTFMSDKGDLRDMLNMYCKSVNLPSRQITTGTQSNVGSAYRYATNQSFSQFNANFIIPQSQYTRSYFERWMTKISSDSDQYSDFYFNYVAPMIKIYKWEIGGGEVMASKKVLKDIQQGASPKGSISRLYRVTAAWELRNAFPYNIGSIQLDNEEARLMSMSVGFYYERYRFTVDDKFDDNGRKGEFTVRTSNIGKDGYTDPSTSRNTTK